MIHGDFSLVSNISVDNLNNAELHKLVPHFNTTSNKNRIPLEIIIKRYSTKSSCILLENQEDIFNKLFHLHKICSAHYKLAKIQNMSTNFPEFCCGISSHNINIALLEHGYQSSIQVYNSKHDHSYNILPFIIKDSNKKGAILLDPTSNQLWNNLDKLKRPKNMISVYFSDNWTYITHWNSSSNLFPDTLSNLKTLENELKSNNSYQINMGNIQKKKSIKKEIKKAWRNPVSIIKY